MELTAIEVISKIKIGINIGNCFDAWYKDRTDYSPQQSVKLWGSPEPTAEWIPTLKAKGFNAIRVPITWYTHLVYNPEKDFYLIDYNWLEYVKKFVVGAIQQDVFVIINCHHEKFLAPDLINQDSLTIALKKLGDIWWQLANAFKDCDQHLIFQPMNETRQKKNPKVKEFGPGDKESWDFINALNMKCYEIVRGMKDENNLKRIIFFNTYSGNSSFEALKNVSLPDDKYVALSVNNYDPYFFTADKGEKSNHKFPGKNGYGKDHEENILDSFKSMAAAMRMKKVEVVITEFGSMNFNNLEDRIRWAEYYLGCARDFNIKCFWWDNVINSSYAIFDRANNKFFEETEPLVNRMIELVNSK